MTTWSALSATWGQQPASGARVVHPVHPPVHHRYVSIFYRDKRYRLLRGIEALMPVITSDIEQFFTSLRNQAVKSGS